MPKNIEIKARVRDPKRLAHLARRVSAGEPETVEQEDVFFPVPEGRLKLRILSPDEGQLIFYIREDQAGPKTSTYFVSRTSEPGTLRLVLDSAYGALNAVRKTRTVFLCGRTRIHLDHVQGLGDFMELEVVLEEGEDEKFARAEADELMSQLEICKEDLVDCAYVDLLNARRK